VKYSGVAKAGDVSYHNINVGQSRFSTIIKNAEISISNPRNLHTDGDELYRKKKIDGISTCEFDVPYDVEKQFSNPGAIIYLQASGSIDETINTQIAKNIADNEVNTDNRRIIPLITRVYGNKTTKKGEDGKSMAGKPLENGPYITHSVKLLDVEGVNPKNIPVTKVFDINTASFGAAGAQFKEFKHNGAHLNGSNFKEIMNSNTKINVMKVDYEVIQSGGGISFNSRVQELYIDYHPKTGGSAGVIEFDDEYTELLRQRAAANALKEVEVSNSNNAAPSDEPVIIDGSVDGTSVAAATTVSSAAFLNL
jgi:hypothetical protein